MLGMNWLLEDIACILDCDPVSADPCVSSSLDAYVQRFVTDSRQIQAGDCFVALVGERVDGHEFLDAVMQAGAVAAIVTRLVPDCALPQLLVADALSALQQLAAIWRSQFALSPCIAVTGSNGKTSVKEMLASILRVRDGARLLATQGNLNNHLGLPMTLLGLREGHASAVIEVGANHLGEIAALAPLAQPNVAMITSIGVAHVGEFGSVEAIIAAKGEIWSALDAGDVAVVPVVAMGSALDGVDTWLPVLADKRVVIFGALADVQQQRSRFNSSASYVGVVARQATVDGQFVELMTSCWGTAQLHLPIMGAHQANNLAAVAAALLPRGVSWQQIQAGLTQLVLPSGRLRVLQPIEGLTVIDDSYNANPTSMVAGINVLMEQTARCHVFVMGAMGELGAESEALHLAVVDAAKQAGVSQFCAAGVYKDACVTRFGSGLADDCPDVLAQRIWQLYQQQPSLAVLVKGSRSSKMERVVAVLLVLVEANNKNNDKG